jgi:hypothetical protein
MAPPLSTGTARAETMQLAQVGVGVDIDVGRPRGGVVIEERRRPGVVIETEGRRSCRTVTVTERENGVAVSRTRRVCD